MRLSCDRKPLLDAWKIVAPVVPARTTMAVLKNVRMECIADGVWLTATDNEIQARAKVDVQPQQPGEVLLPAAEFGGMLTESTGETISIELGQMVEVKSGRAKWRLPKQDAADFPAAKQQNTEQTCTVNGESLAAAIKRTVYAVDENSNRFALGGVLFDFLRGSLTLVSTDARRMALMELKTDGQFDAVPIVPARVLSIVAKSLTSGNVTLGVAADSIQFTSGETSIHSRLLEGRFPRWRESRPDVRQMTRVEIPCGMLDKCIRQAVLTAEMLENASKSVDLKFESGNLRISSGGVTGDSSIDMPVPFDGKPVTVSMAAAYIRQYLGGCNADGTVSVALSDENSAIVLDDGTACGVLMPLSRKA